MTLRRTTSFIFMTLMAAFLSGCSGSATNFLQIDSLSQNNVSDLTDRVLMVDEFKCESLKGKKVYWDINDKQGGGNTFESVNVSTGEVVKRSYSGDIGKDVSFVMHRIVKNHCGAQLVNEKSEADIVVESVLKRYYSQVLEYKKSGDTTTWGMSDKEINMKTQTSTVLKADTQINGKNYYYDHLLNKKMESTFKKDFIAYYVIGANVRFYMTEKFLLNYDDVFTIASGATANTAKMDAFLLPNVRQDMSGHIAIYDPETGNVKKNIMLSLEDYDTVWTGRLDDDLKKEYVKIYSVPSGHLVILVYDYFKKTLGRLDDDLSKMSYFN